MESVEQRMEKDWVWAGLLFALVALFSGFWHLGSTDVITMEGIVADGARTMALNGDYFVPRLHGEIYSYKPPFSYWIALASTRVFDRETEWVLRFPFALSGILMACGGFLVVGARLGPWIGLYCGLASLTGVLVFQKLRIAEFDMPLAAAVGLAVVFAIAELTAHDSSLWRWPATYFCLALGFLAKGVPALVFFVPGLLLATLVTRSWRRLWSPGHILGTVFLVVLCGGWVLGAWLSEGAEVFAQPLLEADAKGLSWSITAFGATLLKPLSMIAVFFPWTLVLLLRCNPRWLRKLDAASQRIALAAGGFIVGGLLTFMAVPATETRYLLPLAMPVGILSGTLLQTLNSPSVLRLIGVMLSTFGGLLAVAPAVLTSTGKMEIPSNHLVLLAVAGGMVSISGLLGTHLHLAARQQWAASMILILALGLGLFQVLASDPHRASSRSLRSVADRFEPHLEDVGEIWVRPVSGGFHHSSLTYYLKRPFRTILPGEEPPAGAIVLLFSDEPPASKQQIAFDLRVLDQQQRRKYRFLLGRVNPPQSPGSGGRHASERSLAQALWPASPAELVVRNRLFLDPSPSSRDPAPREVTP